MSDEDLVVVELVVEAWGLNLHSARYLPKGTAQYRTEQHSKWRSGHSGSTLMEGQRVVLT